MIRDNAFDGPDAPLDDLSILSSCEASLCTTCGGIGGFSERLGELEERAPGHTEALLIEAARVSWTNLKRRGEEGAFKARLVARAHRDLGVDARQRVLAAWKHMIRSSPRDCLVVVVWISQLRDLEIDSDLAEVIALALPSLLASDIGLDAIDRFHAIDPDNVTLATAQRARNAIARIEADAYPKVSLDAERRRAGLRALPFLQRLAMIQSFPANLTVKERLGDLLDDALTAEELESMMLPDVQQTIEYLRQHFGKRPTIALRQLKHRRSVLQQPVRGEVEKALEGLNAVSQLALILGSTRIPLAVVSPTLAAREVVDALPWGVAADLASRERRGTMHWWRRHVKR